MITVFVWEPSVTRGAVGHAAMRFGTEDVSWWPGTAGTGSAWGKFSGGLSSHRSLHAIDDDIAHYRAAGVTLLQPISFTGLDEGAMGQWWAAKKTDLTSGGRYSVADQNCAQTVVDGLRVGGCEAVLEARAGAMNQINAWWNSWAVVWRPLQVHALATELQAALSRP